MCGIIGIISSKDSVTEDIIDSLKRLEYRGYDSSGIAIIKNNNIQNVKSEGKLKNLSEAINKNPINGNIGIGHTRWATHGRPTTINAHPHSTENVAVVHNGIIENFLEIREEIENNNINFETETDTEVIPKLISYYLAQGLSNEEAFKKTIKKLNGTYALCVIFQNNSDTIFIARKGSPLAIGYDNNQMYVASDAVALVPFTNKISYLEDDDYGRVAINDVKLFDANDKEVDRKIVISNISGINIGKGNFRHYMLKEIHEQPRSIAETLHSYYNAVEGKIFIPSFDEFANEIKNIIIVACGTSFYAGQVAKYWIEQNAKISTQVDIASEFRYRDPIIDKNSLCIVISQSGETADTLAAMNKAKSLGAKTLSIVNVAESTIGRDSHFVMPICSGPEIGVASTKAFTAQLTCLACLSISLANFKDLFDTEKVTKYANFLSESASQINEILHHLEVYKDIAKKLSHYKSILYIGRGKSFPIAMEGALKLKEVSYIHAEGYGAGELKHGPIALIDEDMPIIAIAPSDKHFTKTLSNIQEVTSRGAKVIAITDKEGHKKLDPFIEDTIVIQKTEPFVSPIIYSVPVQLLAYYTAIEKGTDVDQPRNLAKSVTVE